MDIGENIGRIIKSDGKISDTASKNEIIYLDFIREIKKDKQYTEHMIMLMKKIWKKIKKSQKITHISKNHIKIE